MISFNNIPADLAVPLFYAEIDNSAAATGGNTLRRLIVGQANDDAVVDAPALTLLSRTSDAIALAGEGSMLAAMSDMWRRGDPVGEVWGIAVKVAEGVAAKSTIELVGTATQTGLLSLYVAGRRVRVTVASGAVAADVLLQLVAAVNGTANMPVRAAIAGVKLELMCKWKGDTGNDIAVEFNRGGFAANECLPAGLTATVTPMAGGAGSPELADVLAAVGDEEFEFVCQPWTDPTSLDTFAEWMNDVSGRWAWSSMLYGHVYSARRGTPGQLVAAGRVRNDQHMTINGFEPDSPRPLWEQAAAFGARQAVFISADPARPTQTGLLVGISAARPGKRFILNERQSLLMSGIATTNSADGSVRIERAVTTYQRNAYGQSDNSYLDSETLHTTGYVMRFLRQRITSKYGRHKLAADGTRFGPGAAIVTPKIIKAELIVAYDELERAGIVENADLFAQYLIVEINKTNPNRVDVLFPPDYINQLRILGLLNQFRLQYPDAAAA
ncbi:phage tail sheath subtilisin-like domain-containing protein [Burkholderia ambifaria]|uniref:phage tail sheath subtilisin-like domain-containing protein n=1 Tax=Burkholderia ambifaria TaxID=152480 RepID=UPI0015887923|nr:phage tail sheath subtilisin-like domain-containing protein [Burkholderia ambifaria]